MRRFAAVVALSVALLAACGGDDSSTATTTTAKSAASTTSGSAAPASTASTTAVTAAPTTTAAPKTTAAPAATAATTATTTAGTAAAVNVKLIEWSIEAGPIKAGTVTFNVENTGRSDHELAIFKGTFASLPKSGNGSVDEKAIPADALVGRIDHFRAGTTATGTFSLPAGQYALVCNLVGGGTSHAARGQVLDVTVA